MDYDNFSNERVITYKHRKGDELNDYAAVILFEYEMDNYTKYQVAIYLVPVEQHLKTINIFYM